MDSLLIVVIAIAALLGAGGLWLIVSGRRAQASAGRMMEALRGELRRMREDQSEGLHKQERALSKTLEERFTAIADRVGDGLDKSQAKTLETMGELKARLAAIGEAQKHLDELGVQMVGLQDILSNKQARGAFGELKLEDLVKDALPPSAYEFQKTLSTGKRVDCLLTLPNPPGPIGIDAKFPLESYHALREADDEAMRAVARRSFKTALSIHIKDIQTKYIIPGETADSALMFLPSEAVYAELHANFPEIVEASHRAKVWITSPTTLMATLLTVRAILKDARMHEQAAQIQKEVTILLEDVERLSKRVTNLRGHFDQAGRDIGEIATSADKVLKRGRKIEQAEIEDGGAPEPTKPRLVSGGD